MITGINDLNGVSMRDNVQLKWQVPLKLFDRNLKRVKKTLVRSSEYTVPEQKKRCYAL